MKKKISLFITILALVLLTACGGKDQGDTDELLSLDVDFIVPEAIDAGETVELKADVTYGDEAEKDATVKFEVWETGDQENSDMIEAKNNGDGTYTAEYTFQHDGVFEMYAHTDAQNLHTMPKEEITVGEGGEYDDGDEHAEHGFHTEGFDMHFMEPEDVAIDEDTELMVHITLNDEPLEDAKVRYEVWQDGDEDNTAWVDTDENQAGEYIGQHSFAEIGTYKVQIHVEDDEDLHEHAEYEIEVK